MLGTHFPVRCGNGHKPKAVIACNLKSGKLITKKLTEIDCGPKFGKCSENPPTEIEGNGSWKCRFNGKQYICAAYCGENMEQQVGRDLRCKTTIGQWI